MIADLARDVAGRTRRLGPGWWGTVAVTVGAGAALVPSHRLLIGLGGGVAMLALALVFVGPCCESCAAGASCERGTEPAGSPAMPPKTAPLPMEDGGPRSPPFVPDTLGTMRKGCC